MNGSFDAIGFSSRRHVGTRSAQREKRLAVGGRKDVVEEGLGIEEVKGTTVGREQGRRSIGKVATDTRGSGRAGSVAREEGAIDRRGDAGGRLAFRRRVDDGSKGFHNKRAS